MWRNGGIQGWGGIRLWGYRQRQQYGYDSEFIEFWYDFQIN